VRGASRPVKRTKDPDPAPAGPPFIARFPPFVELPFSAVLGERTVQATTRRLPPRRMAGVRRSDPNRPGFVSTTFDPFPTATAPVPFEAPGESFNTWSRGSVPDRAASPPGKLRRGLRAGRATASAIGLALTVAGTLPVVAQNGEPALELQRLDGTVVIDGRPGERAWQAIEPLPLTMYFPEFGGSPSERTEIRVAYDDENFYAAGWFFDSDPSGIRINSLYRDRWNGDDALAIYIDVFNDNQTSKWFGITPAGMRFDLLVSDDGATLNGSWDGFWEAATTITAEGWFAEVRIPFSSLGFQSNDGMAVMGLTVTRLVSRTSERVTFPAIEPRFEFRQPSQARDVVLRDVRAGRPLHVSPYALAGLDRTPVLDAPASVWQPDRDYPREVGLDLRFPVTSNLTIDVTANTDFAQVEADDQQVNLDRFSLFFPEKRRFFQEWSGHFDFSTGAGGRLFHSRRIGLSDAGEAVPVLGGARIAGRIGEWDIGLLDMQTQEVGTLPSENFGVARVRRRVLNDYSTLGAMLTTRHGGGERNVAGGVDASIRAFGDDYVSARLTASADDSDTDATTFGDRSQLFVQWQHRATRGLWYSAQVARSGSAYSPGVGYLPRTDFTAFNLASQYFIFTNGHPWLRRMFPGFVVGSVHRNGGYGLESARIAAWLQVETRSGATGWIEPQYFRENVLVPFTIGNEVEIPAGDYRFGNIWLYWGMGSGSRLRTSADLQVGTFFDGFRTQLILAPTWNLSRHLEVGGQYTANFLRFGDRGQAADIHIAGLRIGAALDASASGNALVQYSSASDRLGLNVRLRYNFGEGTDLWLVWNEGLATDRGTEPGLPDLPLSVSRTFILKYTRTFTL
jgi:hypothetical protein